MTLTIGSLFSGIGGLELGLEWAGLGPVLWQCEIDPFCRAVLAKHWPNVTRFGDVTQPREWPSVDLICGGFPCTDVSSAGKRRGLGGANSGLWWHFARVIRQVHPRLVVVENVAGGAKAWLPHVRHSLHVLGYRTRAMGIAAADVGAPHLRRRIFVVAERERVAPNTHRLELRKQSGGGRGQEREGSALAREHGAKGPAADAAGHSIALGHERRSRVAGAWNGGRDGGAPVPAVCRMDDGLSRRMDAARKRILGNAVVPQCAEVAGLVVMQMIGAAA